MSLKSKHAKAKTRRRKQARKCSHKISAKRSFGFAKDTRGRTHAKLAILFYREFLDWNGWTAVPPAFDILRANLEKFFDKHGALKRNTSSVLAYRRLYDERFTALRIALNVAAKNLDIMTNAECDWPYSIESKVKGRVYEAVAVPRLIAHNKATSRVEQFAATKAKQTEELYQGLNPEKHTVADQNKYDERFKTSMGLMVQVKTAVTDTRARLRLDTKTPASLPKVD